MKIKRLDSRGVAHHFLLALAIVGIISAFAFQAVAGHAQVAPETGSTTTAKTSSSTSISNPANCKATRPSVKYGAHSSCAAFLQSKLGFSKSNVDGQFGPKTAAAVKAVQVGAKLKDTSGHDVGPCTWHAIYHESIPASCKDTVSGSTAAKPSPLVYCTYTINPGQRKVEDAHISAAACKQHSGVARSTPTPTPSVQGYKTASISISASGLSGSNNGSATYKLCTTARQINTKGVKATITVNSVKFVNNGAPDVTFGAKTLTANNATACRGMAVNLHGIKWNNLTSNVTAGTNSKITSAYLKNTNTGKVWAMTLSNPL